MKRKIWIWINKVGREYLNYHGLATCNEAFVFKMARHTSSMYEIHVTVVCNDIGNCFAKYYTIKIN